MQYRLSKIDGILEKRSDFKKMFEIKRCPIYEQIKIV